MLNRLRSQELATAAPTSPTASQKTGPGFGGKSRLPGAAPSVPEEEALREYRLASASNASNESPMPVDPTTQFKVARAVGRAAATLLAEMPAAEFAGAFRVMEVATNIVRERQAEAAARHAATSEEGESENATDVDAALGVGGASAASVDIPWARSL
ncbi:unnamed protein product [Phytophthora fragariaefolia]|uniref:Unnamed protein product n=1 Tax=Phytophthora fragariaefolia TaxID=1490495 RepID=A0A9W6X7Y1_9STRA|nr:unnamed protein product [Phytophthora fragariaefolia]